MRAQLFFAGLLLAGATAFAQEPRVSETIDVPITNVDVVVTDSKGNHVSGLHKEDLVLLENGVAREITNFSEMRKEGVDEAKGVYPLVNRRILLVFDLNTLPFGTKRAMIIAARKFVAENVGPSDRLAVVTASNTLTKLTDWTNDVAAINKGLDAASNAAGAAPEQRDVTERRIRQKVAEMIEPGSRFSWTFADLITESRGFAQIEMRDTVQTINVMNAAMSVFGPTNAKKVLVMGGGGLAMKPGSDMFEYLESVRQRAATGEFGRALQEGAKGVNPMADAMQFDVASQVRVLGQKAVQTGITIYALDPDMSRSSSQAVERQVASDNSADFTSVATRASGYQFLAGVTGGIAILGMKAPQALDAVATDLSSYYSIGYRSALSGDEMPKLDIRSKSGHGIRYTMAGRQGSRDSLIEARVVANQMETPATNDLGIALLADPARDDGVRRRVRVKVFIPVKNLKLVREGGEMTGGINVFVSMGSKDGTSSEVQKKVHQLRFPAEDMPQYIDQSLTYAVDIALEPGRTQVSIGVMDQRSEKTGFGRIQL